MKQCRKRARMLLSKRLKQVRTALGLTQEELAQRLGTNVTQVIRWERGRTLPSAETLFQIAQELEISLDWLLGLVDDPEGHLTMKDLTPRQHKLLAALQNNDLPEMIRLLLEIYEDGATDATDDAPSPSASAKRLSQGK